MLNPRRQLTNGHRDIRERDQLLAVLRQEAAWTLSTLPVELLPASDADPRWLSDIDLADALAERWSTEPPRGEVEVWMNELETLVAADIPHGVRLQIDAIDFFGWIRRGSGENPLVVEVNLGDTRWGGDRYLDIDAYFRLVCEAADARQARFGDVARLYASVDRQADHVLVELRVFTRPHQPSAALAEAARVLALIEAPAESAERAAREAVFTARASFSPASAAQAG